MTDTDIDAVRKQKKAEYNKQYRLKRKLLLQASTSTEKKIKRLPSILKDESTGSCICLRLLIYMIRYFRP
jgi:hypothetical protein